MANSIDTIIASRRTALPPHDLAGQRFRRWIAAVCQAEVKHADADATRAIIAAGLGIQLGMGEAADIRPDRYRFPHEAAAGVALNWLLHLQTHENDVRGPWKRWNTMGAESRADWRSRYCYLVKGFLRAARQYQEARAAFGAPLAMEAA